MTQSLKLMSVVVILAIAAVAAYVLLGRSSAEEPHQEMKSIEAYVEARGTAIPTEAADALADERISVEEYEVAVQATLACGEAAGLIPQPVPGEGLRPTRIGFGIPTVEGVPDGETLGDANAAIMNCRALHLDDIERGYLIQQRDTPPEELAEAFEALSACMQDAGAIEDGVLIDFDRINAERMGGPDDAGLTTFNRVYSECAMDVEAELGYYFH